MIRPNDCTDSRLQFLSRLRTAAKCLIIFEASRQPVSNNLERGPIMPGDVWNGHLILCPVLDLYSGMREKVVTPHHFADLILYS